MCIGDALAGVCAAGSTHATSRRDRSTLCYELFGFIWYSLSESFVLPAYVLTPLFWLLFCPLPSCCAILVSRWFVFSCLSCTCMLARACITLRLAAPFAPVLCDWPCHSCLASQVRGIEVGVYFEERSDTFLLLLCAFSCLSSVLFVSLDVPVPDARCTSSSVGSPAHVGCAWCFIACAMHLICFIQCACQWGSDMLASTLLALLLTAGFPFLSRKRCSRKFGRLAACKCFTRRPPGGGSE